MGAKWSTLNPAKVVTEVLAGDFVMLLRESAGADGSKLIDVEDFLQTLGDLMEKFPYAMHGQYLAPQPANAIFWGAVPAVDCTIPSDGAHSCGKSLVAATGDTIFTIKKNGSGVGTMTVGAGMTLPSFSFGGDVSLLASTDLLTVVNPASPDATLALFFFTIFARR